MKKIINEPPIPEILAFLKEIKSKVEKLIDEKILKSHELEKEYQDKKHYFEDILAILNDPHYEFSDETDHILQTYNLSEELKDEVDDYLLKRQVIKVDAKKKQEIEDNLASLSSDEIDKIKKYIQKFYHLEPVDKNAIISAYDLIKAGDYDNLKDVVYNFNQHEIMYYTTIYYLLNIFNEYIDLRKPENIKDSLEDEVVLKVLDSSLKESVEEIQKTLAKLAKIEEIMMEEEDINIQRDVEDQNLVLFLNIKNPLDDKAILSSVEVDLKNIEDTFGGEAPSDEKRIVRMINSRFLDLPTQALKQLGHDDNKPIVNYFSMLFNRFNVWCVKGRVNNPTRIPYFIVPISSKNRKDIQERYHLKDNFSLYMILGLFCKKNDDSEYVRITSTRLQRERDRISDIQSLFEKDFDDLSREEAFRLIDESRTVLNTLKDKEKEDKVK